MTSYRTSQIKTFIEEKAEKYGNLDVEFIRGKSPELVMEKDDGTVDRIPVDKWRTEDIEEFLKARLQNDA